MSVDRQMLTGSFRLMKKLNKTVILNIIRNQGPISRADIAKITGLTPPTVTNIVGELLDTGIVEEGELGQSSGGRKPILLQINAKASFVIGAAALTDRTVLALCDLDANIVEQRELPPLPSTNEAFVSALSDAVKQLMQEAHVDEDKVLYLALGIHGRMDIRRGVLESVPAFQLENLEIRDLLQDRLRIPMVLDELVRAETLGEAWYGAGRNLTHFLYFSLEEEPGIGMVVEGQVQAGAADAAGELAHARIASAEERCPQGHDHCLSGLLSTDGLRTALGLDEKTSLDEVAARLESSEADDLRGRAALLLGQVIGLFVNAFNPERVIIGGALAHPHFVRQVAEQANALFNEANAGRCEVVAAELGENIAPIGAATLALRQLFGAPRLV